MLSISTPHLAEEWWSVLGMEGLISGAEMPSLDSITAEEQTALDGETTTRSFLESARKIKDVAERHLDGPAKTATIIVAPTWKRELAITALEFLEQGGNPKQFISVLSQMEIAQGDRKGEIMGFWARKCCLKSSSGTMIQGCLSAVPSMKLPRLLKGLLSLQKNSAWMKLLSFLVSLKRTKRVEQVALCHFHLLSFMRDQARFHSVPVHQ